MATKKKEAAVADSSKNETKAKGNSRRKSETKPLPPIAMSYSPPKKRSLSSEKTTSTSTSKEHSTTRLIVKYDVGFSNALYLRGSGADLSWEKGTMLKNISPNEWVWEVSSPFTSCEFKVLVNDAVYEVGENHTLFSGGTLQYTPKF